MITRVSGHHAAGIGRHRVAAVAACGWRSLVERILLLLDPRGRAEGHPPGAQLRRRICRPCWRMPDLLSRAVENLVSNAIKYSPAGTEVTVAVARGTEARVAIEVADQRLRHSSRRPGPHFRKILSRAAGGGCRVRRAPDWASRWCARSRNCTAASVTVNSEVRRRFYLHVANSRYGAGPRHAAIPRRLAMRHVAGDVNVQARRTFWSPTTSAPSA